jgi:hypothetical protein
MRKPQINVSLSRRPKGETDDTITETVNSIDWARIAMHTQETAKKLAVLAVVAYTAKKAVDTTSEIAIIAAQAQFNN